MKKWIPFLMLLALVAIAALPAEAQCSICTRTAAQMGEKPAEELNTGILYLAVTPLAIIGFIGYRLWRRSRQA